MLIAPALLSGAPLAKTVVPAIFSIPWLILGAITLRVNTRTMVFDRSAGVFAVGGVARATIDNIHAVQIAVEKRRDRRGRVYRVHEINVVLHDGTRLHVASDRDPMLVRSQAAELTAFLGVPCWDPP